DGQADLQKPPGYYWMVAACGWLNGGEVNAFVARLPAALAGLAAVLLVYLYLRREGRPTAALIAALALATAVHFTAISRTARIDVPLTCAVTAALLAFHRGCCHREGEALAESQPRRRLGWSLALPRSGRLGWHLLSAVAAAVGVMLKGPVALALVGPVAVVWLVTERKPRYGRGGAFPSLPLSSALLGTFLLLALALPWFVWANQTTGGEFARVFFWHHNVERFTGASQTLASYPWWYYVPRFAVDFLPWTPPLVLLAVWTGRSGQCNEDRLFRFGVVWFAVMFVVLSAARFKRSDYLLPLFPGAAITLGCAGEAWLASRTDPRTVRRAWWGFGVVIALVVVGWQVMTFAVEPAEQAKEEKRAFAAMIRQHAPPPNEVLLFRTESHLLAFHLGRPLYTLVEWMDLNDRLAEPGPHFVVMPPEYVYPAHQIVTSRRLVVVARLEDYTTDTPPRPLVFLRTAD
ncbi:MAG TPA: glycosyltransferase family 39 protein, partial [Gemmataceae bacterium]|nr:glycosyltransferase family 39 protein [Gemmataceae bacterium]